MSIIRVCLVLLVLVGCEKPKSSHSHHSQDHGHDHSHHDGKTAQITVWGDRYELFIEHPYLVANKPATFVTHVTDLVTLEPRKAGPVTFVLQYQNETPLEHTEPSPARTGIYLPQLTFQKAGEWSVKLLISSNDQKASVELPAITVFASQADADKSPEHETPQGISFLKEQQWKLKTKSEVVSKRRMVNRLRLSATVSACPGLQVEICPPVAGYLSAKAGSFPSIGDHVKKGQVVASVRLPYSELAAKLAEADAEISRTKLAFEQAKMAHERMQSLYSEFVKKGQASLIQMPSSDFAVKFTEAAAEVKRAKLTLDQAKLNLSRIEKLFADKAKSERELKEAEYTHELAKAGYESAIAVQEIYLKTEAVFASKAERELKEAEAAVQAAKSAYESAIIVKDAWLKSGVQFGEENGMRVPYFELKSPIEGKIIRIDASIGEHISPERRIFTVLDTSRVLIEAKVFESDVSKISPLKSALYEKPWDKGNFVSITDANKGRLVLIGLNVDSSSRTVPVVYEANNAESDLRIGMTLTLYVETDLVKEAIAIPESALVDEEGRAVGFVHVAGEVFQKRDLVLGIRDTGFVEIVSGLSDRERIVTKGSYAVKLASISSILPAHGHAH